MSEGSFTPPPPPDGPAAPAAAPPPPPPPPPAMPSGAPPGSSLTPSGFDFVKPFTYVFEDPRWINKVLIGGLFYLACVVFIGWFFILGYCAQLVRNVASGKTHPLPEWDDLGEYFGEGAMLFGVMLCYIIPVIGLMLVLFVPMIIAADSTHGRNDVVGAIISGTTGCVWFIFALLSLAVTFFAPASLLMAVAERRFTAAFELSKIWNFIRKNIGNYLLAVVVYLIARFLGGFGIFLCCIGLLFTGFWAFLVTSHGFGQVWKLSARR